MTSKRAILFSRIADRIDLVFAWLKWPCAVLSVLLIWPALQVCFGVILSCIRDPQPILPFVGGAAIYVALWMWTIRWWRTTWLSTLEHELTHAFFAVLTFHKVVGLKATWSQGGHVQFTGRGNWLITLSPYFFPTVCWFLMLVFWLLPAVPWHTAAILNGAAFAYHVTSTMRETHGGQTDLKKAGFVYCFAFLPTANLICNGMVVAYSYAGPKGALTFLQNIVIVAQKIIELTGVATL